MKRQQSDLDDLDLVSILPHVALIIAIDKLTLTVLQLIACFKSYLRIIIGFNLSQIFGVGTK